MKTYCRYSLTPDLDAISHKKSYNYFLSSTHIRLLGITIFTSPAAGGQKVEVEYVQTFIAVS